MLHINQIHYHLRRLTLPLTLWITLVALGGCSKNRAQYQIPNVYVNELIYLNLPGSFDLTVQGGWIYHPGGYSGLVVYRRNFDQGPNDFVGYERACPVHWNESCGQMEVKDNLYMECPCGPHKFLLFDGTSLDQASPLPLKSYNTYFDGANQIRITN